MSTFWKTVLSLVVIVAVIFGIKYLASNKPGSQTGANPNNVTTLPIVKAAQSTTIEGDLSSIDTQMKAIDTNSAAIDQSLNDKPVAQTE